MKTFCRKCRSEIIVSHHLGTICEGCGLVWGPLQEPLDYGKSLVRHIIEDEQMMRLYGYIANVEFNQRMLRQVVDESLREVRA